MTKAITPEASPTQVAAELRAVALAIRLFGLDNLRHITLHATLREAAPFPPIPNP